MLLNFSVETPFGLIPKKYVTRLFKLNPELNLNFNSLLMGIFRGFGDQAILLLEVEILCYYKSLYFVTLL
jgi:hypothetical protein